MKRAEVWKNRNVDGLWSVVIWDGEPPTRHLPIPERDDSADTPVWWDGRAFPTHEAALAHALAEVGLAPVEDPDPSRCPMRATDPITTRHPREDGWRCGYEVGHSGGHELFTSDGEGVLYAGHWVHPAEVGRTEKNTEKETNR